MFRKTRAWLALFAVLAGGGVASAAGADADDGSEPEIMSFNFRGTAQRDETPDPNRYQYTAGLYSLSTGEQVGTGAHNVAMINVLTWDQRMTFHLPDGDLVAHSVETIAPDSTKQGYFFTGVFPEADNIVPDKGTGAYAGRTGRVRMSGRHDANKFPAEATVNDLYVIQLNPKS